jgi:hypothetical protein
VSTYNLTIDVDPTNLAVNLGNVTNITADVTLRGPIGATGATGAAGQGLASGGTTGQYLRKSSGTNYDTGWNTVTSSDISDFDSQVRTSRLDQMANPTGSVDFNAQLITNLLDPATDQDAATKAYVDAHGGSGGGSTSSFAVTQTAHGFVAGDIIRNSGTANTYAKAQADSAAHAEIVGIVTVVTDANTFTITTQGLVTTGVPAVTAGTVMFLSASTAGALTSTEPSTLGSVSKPLAIILESSVRMLFYNWRGELINSSSGGGGTGSITVEEVDGAPTVSDVTTIRVTNGTLTNDGGGQVTLNTGGSGDASGPAISVDGNIALFNGTSGKLLKDSGLTLSGSNTGDQDLSTLTVGAASSTDNALVRFDGTTGKTIQNSGTTLSDTGLLTLPADGKIVITQTNQSTVTPTLSLTSNSTIGKLQGIEFKMGTAYDRNWLGWRDLSGRLRTMTGYHDIDAGSGENHYRYEIKTSGDPASSAGVNPNQITRFYITTDVQDATLAINAGIITLDAYNDGTTARTIQQITVGRQSVADTAGANLRILAGGASSGGTNRGGGDLLIGSGISTGNSRAGIQFYVTRQGSSGTGDNTPAQAGYLANNGSGSNNMIMSLHNSVSFTGTPFGNSFIVSGQNDGGIGAYRNTTANTAGKNMTIQASSATLAATDKSGGTLYLNGGVSTGTGTSSVIVQTATPGSTGTTDNTFATRATFDSNGLALVTPLAITSGGTGAATLTGILKGNGTSAITGSATLNDVGVPSSSFSMGSQKITSLADPSSNQDAATKAYVDSVAQGLDAKASVRAATTTAGTLASSFENGDTVDGVVLATSDRILIKNQVTGSENGIYTVNASGAPTRATDADVDAEVTNGMYCFVTSGTANANTGWVLTTTGAVTLGSTALTFAQFSAATTVIAGNGLTLTSSTIDVVGTSNRISVAADSIDISATYVGQTSITTLGTITSGAWNATTIALANGGTGSTTASGARTNLGLGTIATQDANNVSISGGSITGITDITVADGGTGASALTANGILQGNGTSAVSAIAVGPSSTVLVSNGTTASFSTISNGSLAAGTFDNITGVGTLTAGSLGSGFTAVAIAQGGTGQATKTAAFDALSPNTTQGDIIYHNGTNNVRLAKGTAGQILTMNGGATAPAWTTSAANYRTLVTLGSDVASTASTSFQNVTGLSFSVTSGTNYRFYVMLVYTASATTIGLRASLTGPATTVLAYNTHVPLTTTGTASNDWVNGQAATDSGTTSTSSPATGGNILVMEGFIKPSASGTVQIRFAPETATASGIVIKAGSTVEYW